MRSDGRQYRHRGFTLIELVMSSVITATVIVAAGGTLHLLTRGAASLESHDGLKSDAAIALERLRRELGAAVTISNYTDKHIEFTHPDLTGDGANDMVTYDWSGIAGSPLTRQVANGAVVTIVENVRQLVLTPRTRKEHEPGDAMNETPELVILSHAACPTGFNCNFTQGPVSGTDRVGFQFVPNYANASSFTLTRIKLYLQGTNRTDTMHVYARLGSNLNRLETVDLPTSSMSSSSYCWYELAFANLTNLQVATPYVIAMYTDKNQTAAYVGVDDFGGTQIGDGSAFRWSYNGGSTWYSSSAYQMRCIVYGRFKLSTFVPGEPRVRTFVTHYDCRLELSEGTKEAISDTATFCMNQPEITGLQAGSGTGGTEVGSTGTSSYGATQSKTSSK